MERLILYSSVLDLYTSLHNTNWHLEHFVAEVEVMVDSNELLVESENENVSDNMIIVDDEMVG